MPPTSDSQSAIDVLKQDNERLNGQINSLATKYEKLKADHEATGKERDTYKTSAAEADKHKARVGELEGQVRTHTHKAAFAKAAKAAGVHEDDVDDLYQISGYKAEKDAIDDKAIGDLVTDLKEKKPRWFSQQQPSDQSAQLSTAQQAAAQTTNREPERMIPGGGRGGYAGGKVGAKGLTREQLADPKFMLNPNNKAFIAEALAARRAS
jgi:hypothetical protein